MILHDYSEAAIEGPPRLNSCIIRASGQVDAKDFETVVIPAVEPAFQKRKRVRVLYQLAPDFEGLTATAMWDDSEL